ncbi:hypothetical protein SLA2020_051760 [Shorea laevis]
MTADSILSSVMDVTLSKVISVANEQHNLAVEFKQELRRFHDTLKMIQGVLQDAEQKGMIGRPDLKPWLEGLWSIAEEADDVMDEIAYENLVDLMQIKPINPAHINLMQKKRRKNG